MPHLQSQQRLKPLLQAYYQELQSPLAWCTSAGPAEILRALGFRVYFPENHGALLGASRAAGRYIPVAHRAGYGGEICSYLTADIGAYLLGETPLTPAYGLPGIPRPDLIVYNTNQCREVAEWFNFYGREFGCPVVGIYPPRYLETITEADLEQVIAQLRHLIEVGEEVVGHSLDPEQLRTTVRLSLEASSLWQQVLATAQHAPAPLTFFDGTILMAPIVVMRGTMECVDFYRTTLTELQGLIENGIGAVPGENIRIYWEGMPIWGRLRFLAELFGRNRAAVVASTYCNSWVFEDFDPDDPLRSIAYAYTQIFINRGENTKLEVLKQLVREYAVDGVVFHDSKTCFNNSNARFGLPQRLQQETGLPNLIIDGDLNDLRFFTDGQSQTRLETFLEQLKVSARGSA
jgi:benzoyl-CoA reductase/2-hydroxyglutaryl-CoA dehydratase subunit BcrC/BadD/HgdB